MSAAPIIQERQAVEISIDALAESPTNPRRRYNEDEDAKLVESIRQVGVLQPVLVRRVGDGLELVFGHRRVRAARAAGRETVPAELRESMTDLEVLEAQVAENAARADVHPLEEAEAFKRLHTEHGKSIDDIAARVGKSRSHVYQRIKLLELGKKARDAFWDGKFEASVALLIARVPEKLQPEAIEIVKGWRGEEPLSYREAREQLERRLMLRLDDVPWDRDDATLTKAGACTTCPKRTGNQAELFADVESKDLCTDPTCFAEKRKAHGAAALSAAKGSGARILSSAEVKKLYPHGYEHYSARGDALGLVSLDDYCHEDPKGRSYRKLLKGDFEKVLGKKPNGDVIEFTTKKGLSAALKAAGHDFKKKASTGTTTRSNADDSFARRRQVDAEVERRYQARLFEIVKAEGVTARTLRVLAHHDLEWAFDQDEDLAALVGIEIPADAGKKRTMDRGKAIRVAGDAWIDQADVETLVATLVATAVKHRDQLQGAKLPREWKVDAGAIKKEVGEDLKRLAAAAKAAKKAKPKKSAKAKASTPAPAKPAKKKAAAPATKPATKPASKKAPPRSRTAKRKAELAKIRGEEPEKVRTCRQCGCTEADCSQCIEKTGEPCSWVEGEADLCTACVPA